MSVFVVPKNLFLRTYSVFSTQTPTLIGCNLLTIHQLGSLATSPSCSAAISEALNYDTVSYLLTQESEEIFSTYSPHHPTRCTESCCLCRERDSIPAFAGFASLAKKFPGNVKNGRRPGQGSAGAVSTNRAARWHDSGRGERLVAGGRDLDTGQTRCDLIHLE